MVKKSFDQEDKKIYDYFGEEKTSRKQDSPNMENLLSTLRADMVPASEATPAKKKIIHLVDLKLIIGVIISVITLSLIWYLLLGPGRQMLQQKLINLVQKEATHTQDVLISGVSATKFPPEASKSPAPSPTIRPTNTQAIIIRASPSPVSETQVSGDDATKTSIASNPAASSTQCRSVLSITLADVGKTLCVQGTILETIANPTNFMVIFSYEKGAFYWVSYDLVWTQGETDKCYQITGKIDQIGKSPLLVFDFRNLPEPCP